MSLQDLRAAFPDYAKDTKINLSTTLDKIEDSKLNRTQVAGIALACAYTIDNTKLITAVKDQFAEELSPEVINAVKAAVSIMAMNNIYYRFIHLVSDEAFAKLPAKLRMNVIGSPGVGKVDFELYSLAISAINGCGLCIDSHVKSLQKLEVDNIAIQSSIRIAAVIQAASQVIKMEGL